MGRRRVAVIDPGPALPAHVEAVAREVERGGAESVVLLVTHGHADHSAAAPALAARLRAPALGAWMGGVGEGGATWAGPPAELGFRALRDGEPVATDAGELVALHTPGHAREHVAFSWPAASALFVGDLLLGAGETTWVGEYPGCVADYLASLDRVDELGPALLLPAHGGVVRDPRARVARYRAHRRARIAQVERVLEERPDASVDAILDLVYGTELPAAVAPAARASVTALIEHVRAHRG